MPDAIIRSYVPSDIIAIRKIHDANGIDYRMPDLGKFPVSKVLEVDREVRAAYGMQMTLECHLFLDRSSWSDAEGKWLAIKSLDRESTDAAKSLGFTNSMCCVPPGYERFGRRLRDLGFTKIRPDWSVYSKTWGE